MRSLHMLTKACLVFLPASVLFVQGPPTPVATPPPAPKVQSLYVVDFYHSPFRIVDFQALPRGSSLVRFIEVYPACGTYHVRSDDYVFRNLSVQELVGAADVCGSEDDLIRQVNAARRKGIEQTPTHEYAIAAQCGAETVLHHLPWLQDLKFYLLEERAPQIAALWALPNTVPLAKGESLAANADPAVAARQRHRLAEQAAIDVRGGSFDLAESELASYFRDQGKLKLSDFVPELAAATAPEENLGVVENLDHLGLEKYVRIPYPQMALIAHMEGDLSLETSIDPPSGSTTAINVISGHPMLAMAAKDAISKWIFLHPYSGVNPLRVIVHFAVQCPPTVSTTGAATRRTREKAKSKPKLGR